MACSRENFQVNLQHRIWTGNFWILGIWKCRHLVLYLVTVSLMLWSWVLEDSLSLLQENPWNSDSIRIIMRLVEKMCKNNVFVLIAGLTRATGLALDWSAIQHNVWKADDKVFDGADFLGILSIYSRFFNEKVTTIYWLSSNRLWFHTVKRYSQEKESRIDLAVLRNSDCYATEVSCTLLWNFR